MQCPWCSVEISGDLSNKCENCGFFAPSVFLFANDMSFQKWLKQDCTSTEDILPKNVEEEKWGTICFEKRIYGNILGPYYLETSHLYYRFDPKNYNTDGPLLSYENPKVLQCTSEQLSQNCHWICTINNQRREVILVPDTASFGDLLFVTIDGERFYFIVFEETETNSEEGRQGKKIILEKSPLYYRYDPKNYNLESPLWSYENPKVLKCTLEQLNQDCSWNITIEKQKYEVILLRGTASFGDLLFATIRNERYYFIII